MPTGGNRSECPGHRYVDRIPCGGLGVDVAISLPNRPARRTPNKRLDDQLQDTGYSRCPKHTIQCRKAGPETRLNKTCKTDFKLGYNSLGDHQIMLKWYPSIRTFTGTHRPAIHTSPRAKRLTTLRGGPRNVRIERWVTSLVPGSLRYNGGTPDCNGYIYAATTRRQTSANIGRP
jgi:hypothetical protein